MEYWSTGVMRVYIFNTPVLHCSNTPQYFSHVYHLKKYLQILRASYRAERHRPVGKNRGVPRGFGAKRHGKIFAAKINCRI